MSKKAKAGSDDEVSYRQSGVSWPGRVWHQLDCRNQSDFPLHRNTQKHLPNKRQLISLLLETTVLRPASSPRKTNRIRVCSGMTQWDMFGRGSHTTRCPTKGTSCSRLASGVLMVLFHCMVRYGSARLGTVRYGSVRVGLRFHCSLVPL